MALKPVSLSDVEVYCADWMRSLHCGRDDKVGGVGMAPKPVILSEAEGPPTEWHPSLSS